MKTVTAYVAARREERRARAERRKEAFRLFLVTMTRKETNDR